MGGSNLVCVFLPSLGHRFKNLGECWQYAHLFHAGSEMLCPTLGVLSPFAPETSAARPRISAPLGVRLSLTDLADSTSDILLCLRLPYYRLNDISMSRS